MLTPLIFVSTFLRMTQKTNKFITKARLKHGDDYDYSQVAYENNITRVTIICRKHGPFLQTPETI